MEHLDLIVDEVCASLRRSLLEGSSPGSRLSFILNAIFAKPAASSKIAIGLVRDAILDNLGLLDNLATVSALSDGMVIELLRALKVLIKCCSPALEPEVEDTSVNDDLIPSVRDSLTQFRAASASIFSDRVEALEEEVCTTDVIDGTEHEDSRLLVTAQILDRCPYFLAKSALGLGALNIVVEIINSGVKCLAMNKKLLLPAVRGLS